MQGLATVGREQVEVLRAELVELLPRPQLTELLIEVDRWASWSDALTHAGGKTRRDRHLHRNLYAAVLAQACNFGLTAMAEASGISYDTLAWTTEWYLREDTLRAANGAVRRRHPEQQTEQALCLSLVVNAIIAWNTAYLELALEHLRGAAGPGRPGAARAHLASADGARQPYGTYEFPVEAEYARTGYRPLRERAS